MGIEADRIARPRDGWCILSVKWRHRERTLKLAQALAREGFQAWVPVEKRRVDVPRMNAKREVELPLLPGYIFVHRSGLVGLIQHIAANTLLRILRNADGFHIATDRALDRLRAREQEFADRYCAGLRKEGVLASKALNKGDKIRSRDGSFGGKEGVVLSSDRKKTIVCFDRFFNRVEIPTSIITDDEAYGLQSATDSADKRAA